MRSLVDAEVLERALDDAHGIVIAAVAADFSDQEEVFLVGLEKLADPLLALSIAV